jgi:phosphoribosylformimino-5-aminoimidazole carboxamide ribonucleotide (ProFAR) isomerase
VSFDVIPAIDVAGGRLTRLTPEGLAPVPEHGGDPVSAAEAFLRAGARWLHLVDLDLAFTGAALNMETVMSVRRVALFAGARIQASGGVVAPGDVEHLLDVGANRVVLGSAALADRALVESLATSLGEQLVVGVEADGDRVRSRGRDPVDLPLAETLGWLAGTAAVRLLVTSVPRVGALSGPDLPGLDAVLDLGRPVIAAGGIASLEDLRAVRDAGAEGAVVGRAALEGGLDLEEALAWASG